MTDKVILWDWDGTLVDSFPTIHKAHNKTRQAFGLTPWSFAQTKENVARSARDVFPEMFGENAAQAEQIFYESYAELAPHNVVIKPGREAFLHKTQAAGFKHLLISNKRGDILRRECDGLGWTSFFAAIVGAGDAAADKPSAVPITMAYRQAGLEQQKNHCYVGDAPIDAHTACAASMKSILLLDETHNRDFLTPHCANVMAFEAFCRLWLTEYGIYSVTETGL